MVDLFLELFESGLSLEDLDLFLSLEFLDLHFCLFLVLTNHFPDLNVFKFP